MTLAYPISTKTVGETQPGEFIRLTHGGTGAFAVVIEAGAGECSVGLLSPTQIKSSALVRPSRNASCISWGCDWVIEPRFGPEDRAGNDDLFSVPGCLVIDRDECLLVFKNLQPTAFQPWFFGLRSRTLVDSPSSFACAVRQWSIWPNLDQYNRGVLAPLFTMAAHHNE